jgi:hypothetical protein
MATNLVPPGDTQAWVTASGGKVYVAFQPPDRPRRASYTVDDRFGQLVNNQDLTLGRDDVTAVCGYLRAAGQHRLAQIVTLRHAHLT